MTVSGSIMVMPALTTTVLGDWLVRCGFCHGDGIRKYRFDNKICPGCGGTGHFRDRKRSAARRGRRTPRFTHSFGRERDWWRS